MHRFARPALVVAVAALFLPAPGSATQLALRVYTTADGLAREAVNCIVPDSRGFLWFCTAEGLSLFDGRGFVNYGVAQGLPHRTVNSFLETRSGAYLAATDAGLARLDPSARPGSSRKFISLPGTTTVFALLEDRFGVLWGASAGGIYRIANPNDPHVQPEWLPLEIPKGATVRALAEDSAGNLWAGTTAGLCRRSSAGRTACFHGAGFPDAPVNALRLSPDRRLWVGTLNGLWRIALDSPAPRVERIYSTADGLASARVHSIYSSADGTLWVGTSLSLSERVGERFRNYGAEQGLKGRAVLAIAQDRQDHLWAGVDHGLARIVLHGFATFTETEGVGTRSITSIIERNGRLFVASNETSGIILHTYRNGLFTSVRPRYPKNMRYFGWASEQSVVLDREGEWWIATGEGLCRFPRVANIEDLAYTSPKRIFTRRDGLPSDDIFRLFEDSRGDLWITTIGLGGAPARWDRATGRLHHYTQDQVPGYASAYAEDRAGNMWIGCSNDPETRKPNGLIRYRAGHFDRFGARDGVPAGWISSLYLDRAGRLWIASTDGGLSRVDDPTADKPHLISYTTAQGLSSITVRRVGEDRLGRIYIGTARGLDRLDPAGGQIQHYSTADGLAPGLPTAILADQHGAMWFGTTMGLSRLMPALNAAGADPRVYITGLNVNGESRPVADPGVRRLGGILLKPDQRHVQIAFAAPGDAVEYQYKLEGVDARWSTAFNQKSVNYAGLPPGQYRFLVRATTPSGAAGPPPAEVAFTVSPPLWREPWFASLMAVSTLVVVYGAHRYHLARQLEVERIRTRIATDLHDDLGASLSRVSILSELATRQAGLAGSEAGRRLAEIAETARGLVDGMSDIVWAIDPRRDNMRSLLRRVRQFLSETLEPRGIAWQMDAHEDLERLALSPTQRRNAFLAIKEAVHNAARHAQCSSVVVSIEVLRGQYLLSVRDDGRGLPDPAPESGNGLANMRARAAALRGTLEIAAQPGRGTEVRLEFPCRHTYALSRRGRNGG